MRSTFARIKVIAVVICSVLAGQNINLKNLQQLQKSPVAFGVGAFGTYRPVRAGELGYGAFGELLFPLIGPSRVRAELLRLTLAKDDNATEIRFNTGFGLDAMLAYAVRGMAAYPYLYAGAGLQLTGGANPSYQLRGGVGFEGRVAGLSRVFVEIGLDHTYVTSGLTNLRAGIGARFGK